MRLLHGDTGHKWWKSGNILIEERFHNQKGTKVPVYYVYANSKFIDHRPTLIEAVRLGSKHLVTDDAVKDIA